MKEIMKDKFSTRIPISVMPLGPGEEKFQRAQVNFNEGSFQNSTFLFVASGEAHKNHLRLIDALVILANQSVFPKLFLTLDPKSSAKLCEHIEEMKVHFGLNIVNKGLMAHKDILALYKTVDALIYPSLMESFGLPLVEASLAGLPVLASELDYVRDLVDPEETFDPKSSISIARSIKRFMKLQPDEVLLQSPKNFITNILDYIG